MCDGYMSGWVVCEEEERGGTVEREDVVDVGPTILTLLQDCQNT